MALNRNWIPLFCSFMCPGNGNLRAHEGFVKDRASSRHNIPTFVIPSLAPMVFHRTDQYIFDENKFKVRKGRREPHEARVEGYSAIEQTLFRLWWFNFNRFYGQCGTPDLTS